MVNDRGFSTATARTAALCAGAAGVAMFFILELPWYGADLGKGGAQLEKLGKSLGLKSTIDGWQSFSFIDWLLAFSGGLGLVLVVLALFAPASRYARGIAALLSVVATATTLLVLLRLVDPPGTGAVLKPGVFAGLGCAAVLAIAGTAAAGRPRDPRRDDA